MKISEHTAAWMRAALEGKKIQWRNRNSNPDNWFYADDFDKDAVFLTQPDVYEVRIKPDLIVVNGIEVPAPIKAELKEDEIFWVADPTAEGGVSGPLYWIGNSTELMWLGIGILHKEKEPAAAHSKAMLAHKPG